MRLRPIFLTAITAMLGAWPITLDPVFSGLAWALIFGLFASTAFTLLVIPTVYFLVYGRQEQTAAALDLTSVELTRSRKLLASGNVTQQAFDQSESAFRQAQASAQAAQDAQRQAEAVQGYASIASPIDGVVAERLADPGDLASPGNIVMRLFDPSRLMLEAPIREGLVSRIRLGEVLSIRVDALDTNLAGEVREVVPAVDPGSRTFLVKLCITNAPTLMPGMFGVLALPTGTRPALLVPETCVMRVGQLEYVHATLGGRMRQVLVRTVPCGDGRREVVSGLQAGMRISCNPGAGATDN